jgi:carboxymethylenebutenolidase
VNGSGYLIAPEGGEGRGVLVLGSWWGLDDGLREVCDRLADHGYVALAPDLVGDGRTTDDPDIARSWLAERDMNVVADLVSSSATLLRTTSVTPDAPIGVIGLQMGASWALWLASRSPELIGAVSFFYGAQDVDRLDLDSAVQGHFAERDDLVSEDDKVLLSAALHLECAVVECFDYAGTSSGFAEPGPTYQADAAALAWERTLAFLDRHLRR